MTPSKRYQWHHTQSSAYMQVISCRGWFPWVYISLGCIFSLGSQHWGQAATQETSQTSRWHITKFLIRSLCAQVSSNCKEVEVYKWVVSWEINQLHFQIPQHNFAQGLRNTLQSVCLRFTHVKGRSTVLACIETSGILHVQEWFFAWFPICLVLCYWIPWSTFTSSKEALKFEKYHIFKTGFPFFPA